MLWLGRLLTLIARLFGFVVAKAAVLLIIITISLSLSIASFAIPALAAAMSSAAKWLLGSSAVMTVNESRRLRQQVQSSQRSNQDLARQNATLTNQNRDLNASNQRLATENNRLNDQLSRHRQATFHTARRMEQRAARSTMRNVGAIPLESVPILGISTIIVTTAWELRDTCRTLDDMADLQRYMGQEPDMSLAAHACDLVSVHSARIDHYGGMPVSDCRAEAEAARARVFELAEYARAEAPHLIDEAGVFNVEIEQAAEDEYTAIIEICDCIADLECDLDEIVQR